ncbi:hypothetical protein NDN08_007726 [Rhodosorus marinus]|uniref:Aminotransferase class I/classII large domain-containing protein n=1 Tax=Rhodosorus marinus TaxID=101924 RepID=A0AAV8V3U4_9RHOD|nr:hypothetical protein NDN08_007726 [Rhodosorus marinus]
MDPLLFCGNLVLTRTRAYAMRASEDSGAPSFRIVKSSKRAQQTNNPIREFVQPDPPRKLPEGRSLIKLSNGDPTTYGNLRPPKEVVAHLASTITEGVADGYSLSMGSVAARESIATWATETAGGSSTSKVSYSTKDCFLAAGASGALECALGTIADEGDNILVPAPGFPLFRTIAGGYGIETRRYKLDPEKLWEIDLETIESAADDRTRAILINNPSNPCGSVYSRQHCEEIAQLAARLQIPILCDEIYADMTFGSSEFTPMACVCSDVPVLTVGGISKKFVVPGWRLGWILVHDPVGALDEVRVGLRKMTTRMLCPATPMQNAVEYMLSGFSGHLRDLMKVLEENAALTETRLNAVPGLNCIHPQGAMYAMVMVDTAALGFTDDYQFAEKLIEEEAVEVLPGRCFEADNFFRVVYAAPASILEEAFDRIDAFCRRHIVNE